MIIGGIAYFIKVFYSFHRLEYIEILVFIAGIALLFVGYGILTLKNWVYIPTIILAIAPMISFPMGTILGIYILYLLLAKKGRFIFSPEYQDILKATPYIQYTTPRFIYQIFFILLCLFIGSAFIAF
ncbi:hypothetical protein BegalDRAFT_1190 [Beggiatoa alba B18LD]|uniref:Uncharacterized protein n=1 Tax=Beggiatoa alba B18LD TaxID=395493 RepID=I3CEP9_9GAMM|nr:hypothetical protein [Beggiatoa alba]EIJ42092.1 hypothetical protein BegalDRAFT_1190 [Beggiatoa alba B18LD]